MIQRACAACRQRNETNHEHTEPSMSKDAHRRNEARSLGVRPGAGSHRRRLHSENDWITISSLSDKLTLAMRRKYGRELTRFPEFVAEYREPFKTSSTLKDQGAEPRSISPRPPTTAIGERSNDEPHGITQKPGDSCERRQETHRKNQLAEEYQGRTATEPPHPGRRLVCSLPRSCNGWKKGRCASHRITVRC